jgi:small GTP-binding protein
MKRVGTAHMSHFSQSNMPQLHEYRIAVVGPEASGKSCLVSRFLTETFSEEHEHTIEDVHYKNSIFNINAVMPSITCEVNNIECKLSLVDTSGQSSEFSQVNETEVRICHGFIIVSDLSDKDTVSKTQFFYDRIMALKEDQVQDLLSFDSYAKLPIIVVGNKNENKIESIEEAMTEWAEKIGAQFVTIAKQDTTEVVFEMVVCQIVHNHFILPLISDTSLMPMDVGGSPNHTPRDPKEDRKSFRKSISSAFAGLMKKT